MTSIGKSKVSFIGVGKLGQACAEMVAEVHDVVGYDVMPREPENFVMVDSIEQAVTGRDIVFIAVQTPHDPLYDGKAPTSHLPNKDFDYSLVKQVLREVNEYATPDQLVVLISTVLPGTTRREFIDLIPNARFVYNPYLIAMGTVKWDMVNPEMIMIGTEDGSETGDARQLREFYQTFMQNDPRYFIGTWDECECLKVYYNCYSEDTEVLTDSGWKLFSQAQDGDQVLSLDPETMIPEWVTPTKWVSRDWRDEMIHFHSSKDDVLVTPGHNMFAGSMSTKEENQKPGMKWGYKWDLTPAEELVQKSGFVFQRSTEWHNNSPETVEIGNVQIPSDLYVQFMAWFLSEGCVNDGRIIISQDRDVNPEKYEMISEMMLRLGQYYSGNNKLCEGKTGISLLWHEFANDLICYGKSFDKYIPDTIKNMGRDMIRLFLDTYNLGDGSAMHTKRFDGTRSQSDRAYKYYATSSDKMAADLGELIIKVGRFPSYRTTRSDISNKDCHLVYELLGKTSNFQKSSTVGLKFSRIDYSGKVYCAMLPKNHVFLTRRNGKCTWQGNTFISAKVSLVNMIQDTAERLGNINSELVCDALAASDRRIMGPAYMKPGLGDGGACHPRDNIALRWLAEQLDLGYDLFDAIMTSREVQAKNMARRLVDLSKDSVRNLPVVIIGKAYKPLVPYEAGSASMLVGHYVEELGGTLYYLDEVVGEMPPTQVLENPAVYLVAHNPEITYGEQLDFVRDWYSEHRVTQSDEALTVATANGTNLEFAPGSVVVDPWRKVPLEMPGVTVVHYGNTRKES